MVPGERGEGEPGHRVEEATRPQPADERCHAHVLPAGPGDQTGSRGRPGQQPASSRRPRKRLAGHHRGRWAKSAASARSEVTTSGAACWSSATSSRMRSSAAFRPRRCRVAHGHAGVLALRQLGIDDVEHEHELVARAGLEALQSGEEAAGGRGTVAATSRLAPCRSRCSRRPRRSSWWAQPSRRAGIPRLARSPVGGSVLARRKADVGGCTVMKDTLATGIRGSARHVVTADMSPQHLPRKVLSTPSMIRLIEVACLTTAQEHLRPARRRSGSTCA